MRYTKPVNYDAVVIGGGAAGMLCAAQAARRGLRAALLEGQKSCGRKLRITGKGRCNVTNDCDEREFLRNVPVNAKFLYSAINRFPPRAAMELFESLGVPLKVERGNRVFPVSDRAQDIVNALEKYARTSGVDIIHTHARGIRTESGAVHSVLTDAGEIECTSAVICTGGLSYPLTGSTGDGWRFARELGHMVMPARPSLVPLLSPDPCCELMQGFSLKNVMLAVCDAAGREVFRELGELMFTHFGVTGPLVLSASAHMRGFEHGSYRLEIDLKPALDEKKLDARLLRDFEKYHNRDFANALGDLAAKSMIPVLVERSGIPPETKVNSITKQQRRTLLELFKHFSIEVNGTRPVDEAIVTSGGVDVKEIDPRTMGSKLVSGLYFAGEVIDVDAYTGGFNLQIAWSTGYLAGNSV